MFPHVRITKVSASMAELKAQVLDPQLTPFEQLTKLMAVLRSPEGCAWDRKQDHKSLLPYLLEETYEVIEVIESGDYPLLEEELGDLLTQVVFHAQLASERNEFGMDDVCHRIVRKLIHRHPHVFGEQKDLEPQEVRDQWEKIKTESGEKKSVLGGLPRTMPALTMAFRMGEKAGGMGFDWKRSEDVLEKIDEELREVKDVLESHDADRKARLTEEIGDLLFAVSSLARKEEIEPEIALRGALEKFRMRFDMLEERVNENGGRFGDYSLEQLESMWQDAKKKGIS